VAEGAAGGYHERNLMPEPQQSATHTGRNLRAARHAAGLKIAEVAVALGCTTDTIYRWEQGVHEPPLSTLRRLATLYGTAVADLVADA